MRVSPCESVRTYMCVRERARIQIHACVSMRVGTYLHVCVRERARIQIHACVSMRVGTYLHVRERES